MDVVLTQGRPRGESSGVLYQTALRDIGAWLDEAWAAGATLVETPDGWAVRYGFERYSPPMLFKHFSRADLSDLSVHGQEQRRRSHSRPDTERSRRDLFRTIGFELDNAGATNVLLDHVESDLLVTFEAQNPSQGFNWRKELLLVRPEMGSGLLERARLRRAPLPEHNWFSWIWAPSGGSV